MKQTDPNFSAEPVAYRALRLAAKFCGFNLNITRIRNKRWKDLKEYEHVFPLANYAPWLADDEFLKIYSVINRLTKVDKYRCYELWQLVGETSKLGTGAIIEVGVWRGGSGALIGKKAQLTGIKDAVYLCDTFKGVVKAGIHDSIYKGGEHADTSKEAVEELVHKRLGLQNVKVLTGTFPDETGRFVKERKIRLCHIDVDVYQSAKDITDWVWPKLVAGGIVVYDDYGFFGTEGITDFVNEERQKDDRLTLYNLNGHAIVIKL